MWLLYREFGVDRHQIRALYCLPSQSRDLLTHPARFGYCAHSTYLVFLYTNIKKNYLAEREKLRYSGKV
jgi:hypothetical protein